MKDKPTLILDFDGVIHSYESGWKGADCIPDPPVEGVRKAIRELRSDYRVVVYSTRCHLEKGRKTIRAWMDCHNIEVDAIVDEKVPAVAIVDDRGICFEGEWSDDFVEKIRNFEPWHER